MKKKIALLMIVLSPLAGLKEGKAQVNTTHGGLVARPIFPNEFLGTGLLVVDDKDIQFEFNQKSGFTAGGIIRHGFTRQISVETGIIYTKRLYDLQIKDSSFTGTSDFKIIGYEIPLNGMVFIQTGQKTFMSASLGISFDFYPSDVTTLDDYFRHYSARHTVINPSLMAGLGFEYRFPKAGIIYLGALYHRSFNYTFDTLVEYYRDRGIDKQYYAIARTELEGDYFTIDLRYYFHAEPNKKKVKKKSN